jgi:Zn-finger nucleic acid-binding protein
MKKDNCPKCGSSWIGESILETFCQQRDEGTSYWQGKTNEEIERMVKENYSLPYTWRREIGIEIPEKYDGTSYWHCPDCKAYFDRWTMEEVFFKIKEDDTERTV